MLSTLTRGTAHLIFIARRRLTDGALNARPHRTSGRVCGVILNHVAPQSEIETAPGGMTVAFEAQLWGQECAAETAAERA
ncbi:MAG: hypothetical protein ABSF67_07965 [Roseiarcus sp.]|jgi:hypothetical protein